jgi:Rho-binding antiterminator
VAVEAGTRRAGQRRIGSNALQGCTMDEYQPVDCGLHDRLEELATLRQPARIAYRDERGEVREAEGTINDVFASDGVEYLRTEGGEEIRLDRIEQVDGRHYGASG